MTRKHLEYAIMYQFIIANAVYHYHLLIQWVLTTEMCVYKK